jgi:uncharacterized OsmC-like protein
MEITDLKSVQAPLKAQYREDPESAVVTLKAKGALSEGITCSVETGRALAKAGLHRATGGDGMTLCSGDMLLEALVACAGVTMGAVATSLGYKINDAKVYAEGDIDFRGTLAVAKDAPVGFRDIRLTFEVDGDLTEEQRATLVKLTERYCVVLQTIRSTPPVTVRIRALFLHPRSPSWPSLPTHSPASSRPRPSRSPTRRGS